MRSGTYLKPFDVLKSLTIQTELPEDGDNERPDVPEC
jgi:hypothetical protein